MTFLVQMNRYGEITCFRKFYGFVDASRFLSKILSNTKKSKDFLSCRYLVNAPFCCRIVKRLNNLYYLQILSDKDFFEARKTMYCLRKYVKEILMKYNEGENVI